MKKKKLPYDILAVCVIIIVGIGLLIYLKPTTTTGVNSFEECVAAGYLTMETYPRQCRTPDGRIFVEKITPEEGCAEEGERVNRNPLLGSTDRQCCPGLVEDRVSKSYSICRVSHPEKSVDFDALKACVSDEECIIINSLNKCPYCDRDDVCGEIEYSKSKYIAVNSELFSGWQAENCPSKEECIDKYGPMPVCEAKLINDFEAKCVDDTCVKVLR